MKIVADTNVLLRAMVWDDKRQSEIAQQELSSASLVAITLPALCELAWVMKSAYKIRSDEIALALRQLLSGNNIALDRPAAEAGLRFMEAGGDFADGVIAYQGRWLGADTFVSFDRLAVKLIQASGESAHLLS